MELSSYEVVRRAIEFKAPDRLPLRFEALGRTDVIEVPWNQLKHGNLSLPEAVDEWGCTWRRTSTRNMGQVKIHPLEQWSALPGFRFPDPDYPGLYTGMEARLDQQGERYTLTSIFMLLFERLHALHGFENTLTDLYLERERLESLADRIVEYDLGLIENIARRFPGRIHGLWFTDDWGTQQNVFVNPRMWRDFFQPRYRRIFDRIHQAGWHVWMHSCGKINALLGDLIATGVNVINLQQPRALGIEAIGQYRGQVCFESLCDIQQTLPFCDKTFIREEARLLLEHWAATNGGFILSDYGDGFAIGVDDDKKQIMLDAFLELDPWKAH